MRFLLQGALLRLIINLTCCDEVSESRAMFEEQKCGEFPDIHHFVACFFRWGCSMSVTPRNTYNNHAHIEASLGVPSKPYLNLKTVTGDFPPK